MRIKKKIFVLFQTEINFLDALKLRKAKFQNHSHNFVKYHIISQYFYKSNSNFHPIIL